MMLYFFIQSFLTIVIFMAWIVLGNFSGGEVGMTPLTVLITVLIQFVLGSVIYMLIRKRINVNPLLTILCYIILYNFNPYIMKYNDENKIKYIIMM